MKKVFSFFDVVEFSNDLPAQKVKRGERGTLLEFLGDDSALIELADATRLGLDKIIEVQLSDIVSLKLTADMRTASKSKLS